jgi:hypothetical protein
MWKALQIQNQENAAASMLDAGVIEVSMFWWKHSRRWGYYPTGGLGLILVIVIVLVLLGQI